MNSELVPWVLNAILGLLIGVLTMSRWVTRRYERAREEAEGIVREAKREADAYRDRAQASLDERQRFLADQERALQAREDRLEERMSLNDERATRLTGELESLAGTTKREAREKLLKLVEQEADSELTRRLRELREAANEDVEAEARMQLATALARVATQSTAELTTYHVQLPSDDWKARLIGKDGRNIQTFERVTGVDLVIEDRPGAVLVASFDPARREVARRVLERLIQDGRVQPSRIEEVYEQEQLGTERAMREAAEAACAELGVRIPAGLLGPLGMLQVRTSYGQNQLAHSVEVAKLAAALAAELGANQHVCRLAGLLHDLGKAFPEDRAIPHHHRSAELAREAGMGDDVVHAIIAHHEDIAPETTEAWIVRTADAISGSRPGARRTGQREQLDRVRELERLAMAEQGVVSAYAVQAGREVRVLVNPDAVSDTQLMRLAQRLTKKLQESSRSPGSVKVTVIRERRVSL